MGTRWNEDPAASALKRARIAAGLRQRELADLLGVDQQVVSYYERRGIKNVDTAKKYAAALAVAQLNGAGEGPEVGPLDLLEL